MGILDVIRGQLIDVIEWSDNSTNTMVHNFWDALWYACMTATTAGCSIQAITPVGKVISILLALAGMMLLPVFTVYLTNIIRTGHLKDYKGDPASEAEPVN